MKITKIGHCCLVIKDKGKVILTDPGIFSTEQDELAGIDIVLITHEHTDHLHTESLKKVLKNNPTAKVITNTSVGKILSAENILFKVLEGNKSEMFDDLLIEAFDGIHEDIYDSVPVVQNTGYIISNKLFYPGDSFKLPGKKVDILALPVVAPWLKLSQSIDYALKISPRVVFPVHDGFLKSPGPFYRIPKAVLEKSNIEFNELPLNLEVEL